MDGLKTMLNSDNAAPGRTIEVARDIESQDLTPDYADIMTSKTVQKVTYADRVEGLSNALGCKDSVKG